MKTYITFMSLGRLCDALLWLASSLIRLNSCENVASCGLSVICVVAKCAELVSSTQ